MSTEPASLRASSALAERVEQAHIETTATETAPHRMDQKRLRASRIKQCAAALVYLVWTVLTTVMYYSPEAAKQLNESGGNLIVTAVLGPLMYIAVRANNRDFTELRNALPENLRGNFDSLIDIASTVQGTGQGLTPREMEINGTTATVLVPRHVALRISHPSGAE